ncbi:hypothetical protein Q6A83_04130 [Aliarcobacter skirrowii]|uniref:hypothetical protein n=1 Tax=Aliarcobacter skirrowii TaxID=28200 RepID=UPI0029AFE8C4|nr:hypothetical protein [Aliarcobacter skirrowii]MDX4049961.1 hypothetical protein [Aliarcobacter skirrowii]
MQSNSLRDNNGAVIGKNEAPITINQYSTINRESELRKILNCLLNTPLEETSELDKTSYKIEAKLDYNNITDDWYEIITDEFYLFESTINDTLKQSIDGIPPKGKFLLQMQRHYRDAKKELGLISATQDSIKANSSNILNKVFEYLYNFLKSKDEINEHYDEGNIKVLIAFGFIECKILEKP